MFINKYGSVPCHVDTETGIDAGSENFGFKDQKGRECGFRWRIVHVTLKALTEAEYNSERCHGFYGRAPGAPMSYFELTTSPMRDGKRYGPAFNSAQTNTLKEARAVIAKRTTNARKRDAKKFAAFN